MLISFLVKIMPPDVWVTVSRQGLGRCMEETRRKKQLPEKGRYKRVTGSDQRAYEDPKTLSFSFHSLKHTRQERRKTDTYLPDFLKHNCNFFQHLQLAFKLMAVFTHPANIVY